METLERRTELMRTLSIRRHDTASNLATEFKVSKRTIMRDIEALSNIAPIYTQRGQYGGIYLLKGFYMSRMYLKESEIAVLNKILNSIEAKEICYLSDKELIIFRCIILQYTNPDEKEVPKT